MIDEKKDINNGISKKNMIIIFFFSLTANFLGSWYAYAMTHNQIFTQAMIGLCIPFFNLFYANAFVEAKLFSDRLKITALSGLALSIGSTVMLIMQRYV